MNLINDFITVWGTGHAASELFLAGSLLYLLIRYGFKVAYIYGLALIVIHEMEWDVFYLLKGYPAPLADFIVPMRNYGTAVWLAIIYFYLAVFWLKGVDWHALGRMALIHLPYYIIWFAIGLQSYGSAVGPTIYTHVVWVNLVTIGSWWYGCTAMIWAYEHPSAFRTSFGLKARGQ